MTKIKSKKLKDIITLENRISLFQTAMNNSGRNFEGKQVPVEKMAKFASDYYGLAIKVIGTIGKLELEQLEKILKEERTKKIEKRKEAMRLINKIKKTK